MGHESVEDFEAQMKTSFTDSLDQIYAIQNEINLSELSVSDEHQELLNSKSVSLYFKENS